MDYAGSGPQTLLERVPGVQHRGDFERAIRRLETISYSPAHLGGLFSKIRPNPQILNTPDHMVRFTHQSIHCRVTNCSEHYKSGDTNPCKMTEVTLRSHVHYKEILHGVVSPEQRHLIIRHFDQISGGNLIRTSIHDEYDLMLFWHIFLSILRV